MPASFPHARGGGLMELWDQIPARFPLQFGFLVLGILTLVVGALLGYAIVSCGEAWRLWVRIHDWELDRLRNERLRKALGITGESKEDKDKL